MGSCDPLHEYAGYFPGKPGIFTSENEGTFTIKPVPDKGGSHISKLFFARISAVKTRENYDGIHSVQDVKGNTKSPFTTPPVASW